MLNLFQHPESHKVFLCPMEQYIFKILNSCYFVIPAKAGIFNFLEKDPETSSG